MAKAFALTNDKLDELFLEEVANVTRIIDKMPRNDTVVSTCAKWLNKFQKAMPKEKLARNFLLVLMHKQLNNTNTLSYPFTDGRCCQRDLRTLYKMRLSLEKNEYSRDDDTTEGRSSPVSELSSPRSNVSSDYTCESNLIECLQERNKQLVDENYQLSCELEILQSERKNRLLCREINLENLETLEENKVMYKKELNYMKQIFGCTGITGLNQILEKKQPEYFQALFKILGENEEDKARLKQLDKKLGHLLRAHVDHYTQSKKEQKISDEFDALREKISKRYKEAIKKREAAQLDDLSLTAMRYLMLLRKLFLTSFKGEKKVQSAVLKFLEQQFEVLAQDKK